MTRQLPLPLGPRPSYRLADFIAGANRAIIDALHTQRSGTTQELLYIAGAPRSGRTHLLIGQCEACEELGLRSVYLPLREHTTLAPAMLEGLESQDLLAIDDVDAIAGIDAWEQALFGLFNRARSLATRMLFSAASGPAVLPIALPDLRSRLSWGLSYQVQPLDDTDRAQLLASLTAHRGLDLPDEVARYLLLRAPRDNAGLLGLIERLDRDSLAAQRRLTIPFVRERLLH